MSHSFAVPRTVVCQASLSIDFPGKSTGVGCHFLLQGIFPIQGWDPLAGGFFTTEALFLRIPGYLDAEVGLAGGKDFLC